MGLSQEGLESDRDFVVSVEVSEVDGWLVLVDGDGEVVSGKGSELAESSSDELDEGGVLSVGAEGLRELGEGSLDVSDLLAVGSGEHLELSESFESSVGDGSGLLDLEVGVLDEVGHGESLLEDGVQHESVVGGPAAAESGELSDGVVGVLLQGVLEVGVDVEWLSSVDLGEEDEEGVLIEAELDVGVGAHDSLELDDELLDQEGLSELVGDGDGVSGWDHDGSGDFSLDDFVVVDSDDSLHGGESVELGEVSLDDDDDSSEVWLSGLELSQFAQEDIELSSESSVNLLVSGLLDRDVDSDGDECVGLIDLVHVLEDLDDLWKDDDSLDDLLENVRNFEELLDGGVDGDFSLLKSLDNLEVGLDEVSGLGDLNDLWDLDDLVSDDFDFSDLGVGGVHLDDLLLDDFDLLDDLLDDWDLDDLLDELLDDLVDLDDVRDEDLNLDDLGLFDDLVDVLDDFDDSGNLDDSLDDLLENLLDLDDLLDSLLDGDDLLSDGWDLSELLLDDELLGGDFSDLWSDDDLLDDSVDLLDLGV